MAMTSRRAWLGMASAMFAAGLLATNAPAELICITAGDDSCCVTCPQCRHRCELEIKQTTDKHTTYDIECETICIPRVRFPWTRCCEPYQATQRTVQRLKTRTYECPRCEYKWRAVECNPCAPCATDAQSAPQPAPVATAPQPAPVVAPATANRFPYFSAPSQR